MEHSFNCNLSNEKYGIRFIWTIENFRFLAGSEVISPKFFAEQLGNSEWDVQLYFTFVDIARFSGILRQTPDRSINHKQLFVLVTIEDDDGTHVILQQLFQNVSPTTDIIFHKNIISNTTYPYDNFRLCICMRLNNVTPALSIENIIRAVQEVETFQKAISVKPSELRKNSMLDLLLFKPVNFSELPKLKFGIMLTGSKNVYLEMLKIGSAVADIVIYCKVSVINFDNTVNSFTENWFVYELDQSDNVRHIENVMSYDLLKQYLKRNNLVLLLELSLSCDTLTESITVRSVPFGQEYLINKNYVPCEHTPKRNEISESSNDAENLVNTTVEFSANEVLSPKHTKRIEIDQHTLVNDILVVYNEQKYSDLKICVGNQSFYVHKTILQARSPVFATMLENDMTEKQSGIVEIKDVTPETINSFLKFVYSDKLPADLDYDSYIELYAVADKYEVMLLKQKCSEVLKSKISFKTVCDLLVLADLHGDVALKEVAIDFLKKNSAKVFATEQWKSFMLNNVQLAADTMHSIYSA